MSDLPHNPPSDQTLVNELVEAALQAALEIIREKMNMWHDPSAGCALQQFGIGKKLHGLLADYIQTLERQRGYIGRPVRLRRQSPDWQCFVDRDGVIGTIIEFTPYCVAIDFAAPTPMLNPDTSETETVSGWTITGDDQMDSIAVYLLECEPIAQ